jgi:anti-sigma factor (TIGR02949 family)
MTPPVPPDLPAREQPREQKINCAEAMRQLWDYLDAELTLERMGEVQRHLEKCAPCLQHSRFEARFLEALAASREARSCPREVRERVLATLKAAGFAPGATRS